MPSGECSDPAGTLYVSFTSFLCALSVLNDVGWLAQPFSSLSVGTQAPIGRLYARYRSCRGTYMYAGVPLLLQGETAD